MAVLLMLGSGVGPMGATSPPGAARADPAAAGNSAPAYAQAVEPVPSPALARRSITDEGVGTTAELIARLGHPQPAVRDRATAALCEADLGDLTGLVQAYKAETRYEIKLRLRYVVESLYYRQLMEGRMGFLGVQPVIEPEVFDPTLGRPVCGVLVGRVIEGFPAAQAGLRNGDVILEQDGRPVDEIVNPGVPGRRRVAEAAGPQPIGGKPRIRQATDPRLDAFMADITRREPGSKLTMRVLRRSPEVQRITLPPAENSTLALAGIAFVPTLVATVRANPLDPTAILMRPGLCVSAVGDPRARRTGRHGETGTSHGVPALKEEAARQRGSEAARQQGSEAASRPFSRDHPGARSVETGLCVGDVIIGIAGQALTEAPTREQFLDRLNAVNPGGPWVLDVVRTQSIPVAAVLGGRPVDRMNPVDMEVAQMRFAAWWRSQSGECSLRGPDPSLFWYRISPPGFAGSPFPGPAVLP